MVEKGKGMMRSLYQEDNRESSMRGGLRSKENVYSLTNKSKNGAGGKYAAHATLIPRKKSLKRQTPRNMQKGSCNFVGNWKIGTGRGLMQPNKFFSADFFCS